MGESNSRAVEREGEAGLDLGYSCSMLSQVRLSRVWDTSVEFTADLYFFSAIVSCLKGNKRAH